MKYTFIFFQAKLQELSHDELLQCSIRAFSNNTHLLEDVIREVKNTGEPLVDDHQAERPSWCSCRRCKNMDTDEERVCCKQSQCTSTTNRFKFICLDKENVETGIRNFTTTFAETAIYNNRGMRHGAYRQYVMWQYGRLGKGRRIVIPSCCVWAIRKAYPSADDKYRGYVKGTHSVV